MSSSVPSTLMSEPGLPRRIGGGTMRERPANRQRQGLKSTAESSVQHTWPYDDHDNQQGSDTASQLCQRCEKIDLERWLTETRTAKSVGFLDSFNNPSCQFCDIVQNFVKLHWGCELPSGINKNRVRLYMQGNTWCTFSTSNSEGHHNMYRILLAIDQQPPDSQRMRLALKDYSPGYDFVLTELELDPTRLKDAASVPSLRRSLAPCVDIELLRTWLQDCRDHGKCIEHRKVQQSNMIQLFANGFRLIDALEGKLVEKTEPCDYIALSYVWGQLEPPPFRTKKENVYTLSQPSSLYPVKEGQSVTKQVPRTIADAITLCRSLGQRYLWVDSICIVQDDLEEKQRLIHGMDRVYENASLTIVALSSVDAATGLAGITPRIHNEDGNGNYGRQRLLHKGYGTHCLEIGRISIEEHIRSSHWNTRGWTYQEQLLSPRKLYFSSDEVFYECRHGKRREGYKFEGKRCDIIFAREGPPQCDLGQFGYPKDQPLLDIILPTSPAELDGKRFLSIVSTYTRRYLTEPGDVLNAFTGIYHRLDGSAEFPFAGIKALQGHPIRYFFSSLLWITHSDHHERRRSVNGTRPSTWSWTTFAAPVDFAIVTPASFSISRYIKHSPKNSMVDEFRLYFQSGDNVNEIRIRNKPHYSNFPIEMYYELTSIVPHELLELYSEKDPEALPAPSSVSPGVLEFLSPYIAKPTAACSRWSRTEFGEWLLSFEGKPIRGLDGGHNAVFIARLDPGEDTLDGFVLLSWNWSYMGLCVRKMGKYFERVGFVTFMPRPDDWRTIAAEGLLELSWKRILLR